VSDILTTVYIIFDEHKNEENQLRKAQHIEVMKRHCELKKALWIVKQDHAIVAKAIGVIFVK